PEATFLTLAVGSGGGSLNCDIGVFANARILPERNLPCASIAVRPGELTVPRGNSVQLAVSCRDQLGMPHDVTSGAAGTVYSVDPPGVMEVGADGLVTAVGSGETEITVTNGELVAVIGASVSSLIDLGDIVAGGDGTGTGGGDRGTREFTGIDPDSGLLVREDELILGNTADTDGVNPVPVDESEFVDVVFFVNSPLMPINSEQVEFQWQDGDADDGFMQVLSNFSARLEGGDRLITVGAQEFETAVGIHAAIGITFDLDALREEFGPEAVGIFSTFAGNSLGDCGGGDTVRMYIIYSDADGVIEDPGAEGDFPYWNAHLGDDIGIPYEQPIPPEASFLTLAVGAGGDGIACDAAVFADPRIRSLPPTDSDFTRGDANADGNVDLSDGVIALNFLFGGG
ncbi:MAG: Ig-like domain-containing protein, partial [Actinobacteria bacterium]|nr:Ig-like domain-containing protein [Actinomycetota bacterium]